MFYKHGVKIQTKLMIFVIFCCNLDTWIRFNETFFFLVNPELDETILPDS